MQEASVKCGLAKEAGRRLQTRLLPFGSAKLHGFLGVLAGCEVIVMKRCL
jgi:hypothetical protein